MNFSTAVRTLELSLFAAGCVCAGLLAVGLGHEAAFRRPVLTNRVVSFPVVGPSTPGLLARLDVPALHVSLPVVEGVDDSDLEKGAGHVLGTAKPGGLGNVGLAGHRDTFFRFLRRVGRGTTIVLTDSKGAYYYTVQSTEIVTPEAIRVLDIATVPELTLITCFPFDYIGSAPRRFIVHALLNSASPLPSLQSAASY